VYEYFGGIWYFDLESRRRSLFAILLNHLVLFVTSKSIYFPRTEIFTILKCVINPLALYLERDKVHDRRVEVK
jgi:hypothetical protein